MKILKNNRLYCFSPPVMIATFLIEIGAAAWVIWRYHLDKVSRIAVAILVCLAVFQLAEFNICEDAFGLSSTWWARIGFVAITFLPPLGIHLARNISGTKQRLVGYTVIASYLLAVGFSVFFLFIEPGFSGSQCFGNYVVFRTIPEMTMPYAAYYYGLLFVGIYLCLKLANQNKKLKKSLSALAIGYLAFIIPTTTANIIAPETIAAIPSVMCGFAVLLAVMLVGFVLPEYYKVKNHAKTNN